MVNKNQVKKELNSINKRKREIKEREQELKKQLNQKESDAERVLALLSGSKWKITEQNYSGGLCLSIPMIRSYDKEPIPDKELRNLLFDLARNESLILTKNAYIFYDQGDFQLVATKKKYQEGLDLAKSLKEFADKYKMIIKLDYIVEMYEEHNEKADEWKNIKNLWS